LRLAHPTQKSCKILNFLLNSGISRGLRQKLRICSARNDRPAEISSAGGECQTFAHPTQGIVEKMEDLKNPPSSPNQNIFASRKNALIEHICYNFRALLPQNLRF
jgi:hypothetical protein